MVTLQKRSDWRKNNRGRKQERHGKRQLPEYQVWLRMKGRCHTKTDKRYELYGARGIKVCKAWRNSFETFYNDMGPRPSDKHLLERKDNNKGYSPDNCTWATYHEQSRNKRNNVNISFRGKTQCVTDWAKETGISKGTIRQRINNGWSVEKALTVPPGSRITKRSRVITYKNKTLSMKQWAEELGVNYGTLKGRISKHGEQKGLSMSDKDTS